MGGVGVQVTAYAVLGAEGQCQPVHPIDDSKEKMMTVLDDWLHGVKTLYAKAAVLARPEHTPDPITHLESGEVMVFGSNRYGLHAGGAARAAYENFGAVWGEGEGHYGQSYALPTMGSDEDLAHAAAKFIQYAQQHPELTFYLTRVGCGIAGRTPRDVAPFFAGYPANVIIPADFAALIQGETK